MKKPDHFEHFIVIRPSLHTQAYVPYDIDGALAFIKKIVPILQRGSHWLVFADSGTVNHLRAVQAALGATFEEDAVPNNPGFVLFSYPKALIGRCEFVRAINEHTPLALSEEDEIADFLALASTPDAIRVMVGWERVFHTAAKGEEQKPGLGYGSAAEAMRQTARNVDRAQHAHLN